MTEEHELTVKENEIQILKGALQRQRNSTHGASRTTALELLNRVNELED